MKGSVIHEHRPKFPQQVFSQLQRSWTPITVCPSSSRCHFHFIFLNSPHKSVVCAGKFGKLSNNIFWKPSSGTFSACVSQISGALKVFVSLIRMNNRGGNQSSLRMIPKFSVTMSASVPIRRREQRTSQKQWCCILQRTPLHLNTSEKSPSQSLSLDDRHGHSPKPPSFHLLFNVPIFVR